jgi:hypothetical protein
MGKNCARSVLSRINSKAHSAPWLWRNEGYGAFHGWEGFRKSFSCLRNKGLEKFLANGIAWQINAEGFP